MTFKKINHALTRSKVIYILLLFT